MKDSNPSFNPSEDYAKISELTEAINKYSLEQNQCDDVANNCQRKRRLAGYFNERGFRYYKRVEFDLAVSDYTDAIKHASSNGIDSDNEEILAAAHYNRGTVMYRMSNFSSALEDFHIAVKLAPNNAEFQLGQSETQARLNESSTKDKK